jgi:hypothetical protein
MSHSQQFSVISLRICVLTKSSYFASQGLLGALSEGKNVSHIASTTTLLSTCPHSLPGDHSTGLNIWSAESVVATGRPGDVSLVFGSCVN